MNAAIAMPVRQASVVSVIGTLLSRWLPVDAQWLAAAVLISLAGIHLLGVRVGALAQRGFTTAKLATSALVIVLATTLGLTGEVAPSAFPAAVSFATAVGAV